MSFSVTITIYKTTHFTIHIYIINFIPLVRKYFLIRKKKNVTILFINH